MFRDALRRTQDAGLLLWFALSPFASWFIRYPVDRSLLTFDRAMIALCAGLLWLRLRREPAGWRAMPFEIFWALLASLAAFSVLISSAHLATAMRTAVDAFWLPLAAFHLARHHARWDERKRGLWLAAAALAFGLLAAGAYEYSTARDLFAYSGSSLFREGELRVNGPFTSDSSYAIIGLMAAVVLAGLPRLSRLRMDESARLLHLLAIAAAAGAALLPRFRAVALALLLCWAMAWFFSERRSRATCAGVAGVALAALLIAGGATLALFGLEGRLASGYNLYGRLATWRAAAGIAAERPAFGVGLGNYTDVFAARYADRDQLADAVRGVRAVNSPHSNLFWIASELGIAGLALYLAAFGALALSGVRALRREAGGPKRAAAACFLALLAAYWIPGLTLTSGAYGDVNLYFFFLAGLLASRMASGEEAEG